MSRINVRVLTREDIRSLLSLDRIIETTEELFRHIAAGEASAPPKLSLPLSDAGVPGMHWINAMPAFLRYENTVGIKWVNVTSENRTRGLPVTMAVIILNDGTTGMPTAIMDGTWITHARTGASTAVAARHLARPDSEVITVIGAGDQGRWGLRATSRLFDFDEVRVVDIDESVLAEYVRTMSAELAATVRPFSTAREAVRDSDIVLLTSTAQEPLMLAEWAEPGQFITTVSCLCDLDPGCVEVSDKFVVDDVTCSLSRIRMMAGVDISAERVYADICQIATGEKAGREGDREIITYVPAGMGALDVAVASEALALAREQSRGHEVTLLESV
jgi:ornithine cyclodeaminase/alanine dehydrogenase-like protein (mu-crystallin family)